MYGDEDLVKSIIIKFKKVKEINEEQENSENNDLSSVKPEQTGGNRLMTGGDLSAELVDKDNPNLLLSFVTDTNVVQESGINSLHSFLDGKFARRISLYNKNNFKYGFNNEERLYFNLVNQVGYNENLAHSVVLDINILWIVIYLVYYEINHQVFTGICYCNNENEEEDWYSLYIINLRKYENKLGKITMMVRDAIFDTC